MAPRWVNTEDHNPGPYFRKRGVEDWLLLSGGFVIGRVTSEPGNPSKNRYSWSLTGPHTPEAPVPIGGTVEGATAAKAALLASWRAWQVWAGQRDEAPPPLPPDQRPQDPHLDGRELKFEALEHGGAEPDTMPQAVRVTDPQGRTAVYALYERRDPEA